MLNRNFISANWGIHTVEATLQFEEYRGKVTIKVKGNCKGLDILKAAEDYIAYEGTKSNCNFKVVEDGFECTLKNKNGDTLEFSDTLDRLERYIVKLEIVDFKEGVE